jgi:hypothetical protein
MGRRSIDYLAGFHNPSNFANYGFKTAEIRPSVKHETNVKSEVVSIVVPPQGHWKAHDVRFAGSAGDQSTTENGCWNDVFPNFIKDE